MSFGGIAGRLAPGREEVSEKAVDGFGSGICSALSGRAHVAMVVSPGVGLVCPG